MPSNSPTSTGKGTPPPTSRRSARQRRLASREASRALARAGTGSSAGGGLRTVMIWTGVAVLVGAVVIGAAVILTKPAGVKDLGSPIQPSVVTPRDIQQSDRTLGNPDAKVTIDVYEDFRCTGCFAFRTEIEPTVEQSYIATGKAKLVYHDFITIDSGSTTESRDAANAALCAADQGKFWTMHDWLFANQSPRELPGYFTIDRLLQIGQAAGMDMSTFEPCVRQGTHNQEVAAEQQSAPSSITATPSIFVNGTLVVNPDNANAIPDADMIGAAIDGVLNPSPSPSASGSASASGSPAESPTAAPSATPAASAS
jgi:protein-disulfide isomerase